MMNEAQIVRETTLDIGATASRRGAVTIDEIVCYIKQQAREIGAEVSPGYRAGLEKNTEALLIPAGLAVKRTSRFKGGKVETGVFYELTENGLRLYEECKFVQGSIEDTYYGF